MDELFFQILSGAQAGKRVRAGQGLTFGRSPENAISFSGADGTLVSGRHAAVEKRGETWTLRDLGSTNGSFVDGERVMECVLKPGQVISLGAAGPKLRVQFPTSAPPPFPGKTPEFLEPAESLPLEAPFATSTPPSNLESLERSETLFPAAANGQEIAAPPNPAFSPREGAAGTAHVFPETRAEPQSWMESLERSETMYPHTPAATGKSAASASPPTREPTKPPSPPEPPARSGAFPSGGAGDYTMGLAQRLRSDEAGHDELRDLIKDKGRAGRIVRSGALSKRESRMIHSAAATYSAQKRRALWITASISGAAAIAVAILLLQNLGYRGKLKAQQSLLNNVKNLEHQLAEAGERGPAESEEEKEALVARLRAAERQLVSVRSNLRSSDVINTYKNPLGREIHAILEGFGKRDYIVPDIFISQVEKHIRTFAKNSTGGVMARSLANKSKYQRIIEDELLRQRMPAAFFYLAMHESMLDPEIVSRAGARGLWQFMPQTGRDYGLRVPENWQNLPPQDDERTNPVLSTQAGVKYVKTLYAEFGDVALAMAAYNAGEGRIRKALRSIDDPVNNRDFWYIYRLGILADETNEYVPKIVATMIIDKNRARYGFAQ